MAVIYNLIILSGDIPCKMCASRHKVQSTYLEQVSYISTVLVMTSFSYQIYELYEDFHIVECPLFEVEVRGREKLELFSKYLVSDKKE